MRFVIPLAALFLALPPNCLHAADNPASSLVTFYVSGVECGSCVYMVQQAVTEAKGVEDIKVAQGFEG